MVLVLMVSVLSVTGQMTLLRHEHFPRRQEHYGGQVGGGEKKLLRFAQIPKTFLWEKAGKAGKHGKRRERKTISESMNQ